MKYNIIYFILFILVLSNIKLFSENKNNKDTLKIKTLPAIEVTAERNLSNSAIEYIPHTVIEKNDINSLAPIQISDILTLSPGVNVRDYGGLSGMKTVSIRGTGSSRTLVTLDGMPINSIQNSSIDLSNIAVSIIDNIEIVRGGTSAIYGGNAVGGTINLRTDLLPDNIADINLGIGSFGEFSSNISGNLVGKNGYLSANASYIKSDGDFDFNYNQFGNIINAKRINADYENLSLSLAGKTKIDKWDLWSRIVYNKVDKGVPGAVLQGILEESQDRLTEDNWIISFNSKRILNEISLLKISLIAKINNSTFLEPSKTAEPESNFNLWDIGINAKYLINLFNIDHEILASCFNSQLSGNMLDPDADSLVKRTSLSFSYMAEKNITTYYNNKLNLNMGGRVDYITDSETALSYLATANYMINKINTNLLCNFSHNFRAPNFNEMYYRNYGTKDLKNETSNNINLGLCINNLLNYFSLEFTWFHINTKDMIVSVPKTPVTWSAKNIDNVHSTGIELAFNLKKNLIDFIDLFSVSYTLQNTLDKTKNSITYNKQLPYVPQEQITTAFDIKFPYKIHLGSKIDYSSFRYIQPDNDSKNILPKYLIADVYIYKEFDFNNLNFILRFDCKNLFNEQYELIQNYIMPGRAFKAGIGLKL